MWFLNPFKYLKQNPKELHPDKTADEWTLRMKIAWVHNICTSITMMIYYGFWNICNIISTNICQRSDVWPIILTFIRQIHILSAVIRKWCDMNDIYLRLNLLFQRYVKRTPDIYARDLTVLHNNSEDMHATWCCCQLVLQLWVMGWPNPLSGLARCL